MKVKLGDLEAGVEHLQELAAQKMEMTLVIRFSTAMREVKRQLDLKSEAQQKLLERLGKPVDGRPGTFNIPIENRGEYAEQLKKLGETDVQLTGIQKVRLSVLAADGIRISGQQYFHLSWLLKNDLPKDDTDTEDKETEAEPEKEG